MFLELVFETKKYIFQKLNFRSENLCLEILASNPGHANTAVLNFAW